MMMVMMMMVVMVMVMMIDPAGFLRPGLEHWQLLRQQPGDKVMIMKLRRMVMTATSDHTMI